MDTLLKETVNATVNSRYPGMAPEGRRQLEEILVRKEVEKGELLLKEGQVSHNIVLVGKGMLRQFYYKNGKDVTEHFSYEGCIVICIESTLKKEPTHLMIEALEDSVVYLLPYDKLMLLTEISWEINMFYQKILEYSLIVSQDTRIFPYCFTNQSRFLAVRDSTRTLQPADGAAAGSHQARPSVSHRLLSADDSRNLKPGTFGHTLIFTGMPGPVII